MGQNCYLFLRTLDGSIAGVRVGENGYTTRYSPGALYAYAQPASRLDERAIYRSRSTFFTCRKRPIFVERLASSGEFLQPYRPDTDLTF